MSGVVAQVLVLAGSVFVLLAAMGAMRMPDFYMRLSTVTKGGTLGLVLLLSGVLVALFTPAVLLKVGAVLVFAFVTSPVAAHMVSRAAYFQGVSLWEGTVIDELKGQYEMRYHLLQSPEPEDTLAFTVLGVEEGEDSADG